MPEIRLDQSINFRFYSGAPQNNWGQSAHHVQDKTLAEVLAQQVRRVQLATGRLASPDPQVEPIVSSYISAVDGQREGAVGPQAQARAQALGYAQDVERRSQDDRDASRPNFGYHLALVDEDGRSLLIRERRDEFIYDPDLDHIRFTPAFLDFLSRHHLHIGIFETTEAREVLHPDLREARTLRLYELPAAERARSIYEFHVENLAMEHFDTPLLHPLHPGSIAAVIGPGRAPLPLYLVDPLARAYRRWDGQPHPSALRPRAMDGLSPHLLMLAHTLRAQRPPRPDSGFSVFTPSALSPGISPLTPSSSSFSDAGLLSFSSDSDLLTQAPSPPSIGFVRSSSESAVEKTRLSGRSARHRSILLASPPAQTPTPAPPQAQARSNVSSQPQAQATPTPLSVSLSSAQSTPGLSVLSMQVGSALADPRLADSITQASPALLSSASIALPRDSARSELHTSALGERQTEPALSDTALSSHVAPSAMLQSPLSTPPLDLEEPILSTLFWVPEPPLSSPPSSEPALRLIATPAPSARASVVVASAARLAVARAKKRSARKTASAIVAASVSPTRHPSARRARAAPHSLRSRSKQIPTCPIRAILFDLDGVLSDSEELHRQTFNETFARFGVSVPRAYWYAHYIGTGSRHIVQDLIRSNGLAARGADEDSLVAERKARFQAAVEQGRLGAVPGAQALVAWARAHGLKTIVASGGHRDNIAAQLRALGLANLPFLGLEDVKNRKPDPEVFLKAARRIGVPARECLVIEDSSAGAQAARAGGMRCVLIGEQHAPALRALVGLHLPRLERSRIQRYVLSTLVVVGKKKKKARSRPASA